MKIIIIDDDQIIADYVRSICRVGWPEANVISSGLGEHGIELVEEQKPDIVILDLGLPDISGLEVLKQIRLFSSVPIMILSVRGEESDIVEGLGLGADEYIVKPFRQLELLARARVLLRRQEPIEEDLSITCGSLRFGDTLNDLMLGERKIKLTKTEGQILYHLMVNSGKIVKTANLVGVIWGNEYSGDMDGIKTYVYRLRKKLEDNAKNPRIILNKPGVGYLLIPPE